MAVVKVCEEGSTHGNKNFILEGEYLPAYKKVYLQFLEHFVDGLEECAQVR